ncbi:MAG: hypothetical protein QM749_18190 [Aquabacterium sp.]
MPEHVGGGPAGQRQQRAVDPLDGAGAVGDGHAAADARGHQGQAAEVLGAAGHVGAVGVALGDEAQLDGGDLEHGASSPGRREVDGRVVELEQGQRPAVDGDGQGHGAAGAGLGPAGAVRAHGRRQLGPLRLQLAERLAEGRSSRCVAAMAEDVE